MNDSEKTLKGFAHCLELEEDRSPRTVQECLRDARLSLHRFEDCYGRPPAWDEMSSQHGRAFLADRVTSPDRTVRLLTALRKLYHYLAEGRGLLGHARRHDPDLRSHLPPPPRRGRSHPAGRDEPWP